MNPIHKYVVFKTRFFQLAIRFVGNDVVKALIYFSYISIISTFFFWEYENKFNCLLIMNYIYKDSKKESGKNRESYE